MQAQDWLARIVCLRFASTQHWKIITMQHSTAIRGRDIRATLSYDLTVLTVATSITQDAIPVGRWVLHGTPEHWPALPGT